MIKSRIDTMLFNTVRMLLCIVIGFFFVILGSGVLLAFAALLIIDLL